MLLLLIHRTYLIPLSASLLPPPPDLRTRSFQIPLPSLDTTVAVFRQTLSEHTHLPPNSFKLIYAGAVMKDDSAPCEYFLPITRHP
jgi:hypothetical protein